MIGKIIGIVGTRRRDSDKDFKLVRELFLELYIEGDIICSGLCPKGGDRFAVKLSKEFNTPTLWFPANWNRFDKSAGFVRNDDIAQMSAVLIVCIAGDRTGGTEDTIKKFIKYHGKEELYLI